MVRSLTRTLAALRDALLPKLISGELRVPAGIAAAAQERPSRSAARAVRGAGVSSKERAHRV